MTEKVNYTCVSIRGKKIIAYNAGERVSGSTRRKNDRIQNKNIYMKSKRKP